MAWGAGVYEIVDRGGRRTSFAYKLEIPAEPGEVQKELQIRQEASYTLSIKVNTRLVSGRTASACIALL